MIPAGKKHSIIINNCRKLLVKINIVHDAYNNFLKEKAFGFIPEICIYQQNWWPSLFVTRKRNFFLGELAFLPQVAILLSLMLNLYSERFASITRGHLLTAILERLPAACRSLSTLRRRDRRVSSGRFVFRQRPVAVLQGIRVGNHLTSSLLPCDRYYRSHINGEIAWGVCFELSRGLKNNVRCIIKCIARYFAESKSLLAFD